MRSLNAGENPGCHSRKVSSANVCDLPEQSKSFDWDYHAQHADTEAELEQLRDG
jgi:hypothetical protein